MEFIKCKLCREPFSSMGSPICPACTVLIDQEFFTVRDYIYDHPRHSSVEEITEATGVAEKHIVYLLETGRLVTQNDLTGAFGNLNSELKCKVCHRPISMGTMCESCKNALAKEFESASEILASKKSGNSSYISPRSAKGEPEKIIR